MKYILVNKVPVPCDDVLEWAEWFEKSKVPGIMDWFRGQSTGEYEVMLQTRFRSEVDGGFADLTPPSKEWRLIQVIPAHGITVLLLWARAKTVGDVLNEKRVREP